MTIEQMRERKTELGLTTEMISEQSGVPVSTVRKIFSGATKAPRKATIDAITAVLDKASEDDFARKKAGLSYRLSGGNPGIIKESSLGYSTSPKKEKKYTIEDYYALPDERRVELIDGVFYDMPTPSLRHQEILLELAILFKECVELHEHDWSVYIAPCDVRLDRDNYTMVQPDIFVICGEYDREARRLEGAPDLAVEILSPSSRSKDMLLKLYKYQHAGVREYWVVDPKHRVVLVHCFDEEEYFPRQYDFDSVIPVGITGGKCSIDFSKIR